MRTIQVTKGQIIQHKGDIHTKVYRVKSGLIRSYSIDSKGKEHIYLFGSEGWVIADGKPSDTPCDLYIDAIEDSTLEVLDKDINTEINIDKLIKRLERLQERVIMLMSSSAIERYEHFEKTYPQLIARVPQKMIASYLGITPEALSKVKALRRKS